MINKWQSICLLFLSASFSFGIPDCAGQEKPERAFGVIVFAQGNEMSIYRSGKYVTYDLTSFDVTGLPLLAGDLIGTEAATYLEIQLYPTRTLVKIAENTTFSLKDVSSAGGADFELAYGRMRAKVEKLTGRDPFSIRSRGTVAGVRGTDFGFDFVAPETRQEIDKTAQVYCFEGEVEVTTVTAAPPAGEKPPVKADPQTKTITIRANEMVQVQAPEGLPTETQPLILKKTPIKEEVAAFWVKNDIRTQAVEPERLPEIYPGLADSLKTGSFGTEKLKILDQPAPRDKINPPTGEKASEAQMKETSHPSEAPESASAPKDVSPAVPLKIEDDWQKRMKEIRRKSLLISGFGGLAIGAAVITAGVLQSPGSSEQTNLLLFGGAIEVISGFLLRGTAGD